MALHALAGFMADVTAAEIVVSSFAVTIFALIRHPVTTFMRDRFLVFVAIGTVAGRMTGCTEAAVMRGFNSVAACLPTEFVIFGFFCFMTLLTESLSTRMTVSTGSRKLAGETMFTFPVLTVAFRFDLFPNLVVAGFAVGRALLDLMTFQA